MPEIRITTQWWRGEYEPRLIGDRNSSERRPQSITFSAFLNELPKSIIAMRESICPMSTVVELLLLPLNSAIPLVNIKLTPTAIKLIWKNLRKVQLYGMGQMEPTFLKRSLGRYVYLRISRFLIKPILPRIHRRTGGTNGWSLPEIICHSSTMKETEKEPICGSPLRSAWPYYVR